MQIFTQPKIGRGKYPPGVYKIIFDGQYFYIGSSVNMKSRITQWKVRLRSGTNKNKRIRELFKKSKEIKFEILEVSVNHKEREDFYIKSNWNNPYLLNMCPNAHNNIGLKNLPRESMLRRGGKPIAAFDLNWNFIERFDYIADANKKVGLGSSKISSFLNGKCQYIKGYKFKLINEDGSYVEPKPFISKKPPLKPKRIKQPITPSKEIIKFSIDGNEIERFSSMRQLVKHLEVNRGNIKKILNGKRSKTGYYKGYIYRYA